MSTSTSEQTAPVEEQRTLLLDAKQVAEEYGINLATAYRMMRLVGCIDLAAAGIKKLYVRREELERFLADHTTREPS